MSATIALAGGSVERKGNFVVPGSKAAGLSSCVRETGFMRRNHMKLLLHQRHVSVHEGILDSKYQLTGCVDCHVSYDDQQRPIPIYEDGQFCRTCHNMAGVELTCYGCHATVPAETDAEARYEIAADGDEAGIAETGPTGAQSAAAIDALPALGESGRRKGD